MFLITVGIAETVFFIIQYKYLQSTCVAGVTPCDDLAIGLSKSVSLIFISIWVMHTFTSYIISDFNLQLKKNDGKVWPFE
jgi:hypothetical protein